MQRIEPGLLLRVEGECDSAIVQLHAGIMVGQGLRSTFQFQLRQAARAMPVFVVFHRPSDQQIAALVRILQQGTPRFFG